MTDIDTQDLTSTEARRLTDRIKSRVSELLPMLLEAFQRRAWLGLGYDDWDAYCDAELRGLRLPVGERGDAAAELYAGGMSQRAIGSALGVDHKTVGADLRSRGENSPRPTVTDTLGRQQPATKSAAATGTHETSAPVDDRPTMPVTTDQPADLPAEAAEPAPAVADGTASPAVPSAPPVSTVEDGRRDAELDAVMADTAVRFRRNFSSAIATADDLWQYDVERIAEVYAGDFGQSVRPFLDEMTAWCERVAAAHRRRSSGLRLMAGGRQ